MGDYEVELCVLIQAALYHSAGSQGLMGYSFVFSLWFYLTELEGEKGGVNEYNLGRQKEKRER